MRPSCRELVSANAGSGWSAARTDAHSQILNGRMVFPCPFCPFVFASAAERAAHDATAHPAPAVAPRLSADPHSGLPVVSYDPPPIPHIQTPVLPGLSEAICRSGARTPPEAVQVAIGWLYVNKWNRRVIWNRFDGHIEEPCVGQLHCDLDAAARGLLALFPHFAGRDPARPWVPPLPSLPPPPRPRFEAELFDAQRGSGLALQILRHMFPRPPPPPAPGIQQANWGIPPVLPTATAPSIVPDRMRASSIFPDHTQALAILTHAQPPPISTAQQQSSSIFPSLVQARHVTSDPNPAPPNTSGRMQAPVEVLSTNLDIHRPPPPLPVSRASTFPKPSASKRRRLDALITKVAEAAAQGPSVADDDAGLRADLLDCLRQPAPSPQLFPDFDEQELTTSHPRGSGEECSGLHSASAEPAQSQLSPLEPAQASSTAPNPLPSEKPDLVNPAPPPENDEASGSTGGGDKASPSSISTTSAPEEVRPVDSSWDPGSPELFSGVSSLVTPQSTWAIDAATAVAAVDVVVPGSPPISPEKAVIAASAVRLILTPIMLPPSPPRETASPLLTPEKAVLAASAVRIHLTSPTQPSSPPREPASPLLTPEKAVLAASAVRIHLTQPTLPPSPLKYPAANVLLESSAQSAYAVWLTLEEILGKVASLSSPSLIQKQNANDKENQKRAAPDHGDHKLDEMSGRWVIRLRPLSGKRRKSFK